MKATKLHIKAAIRALCMRLRLMVPFPGNVNLDAVPAITDVRNRWGAKRLFRLGLGSLRQAHREWSYPDGPAPYDVRRRLHLEIAFWMPHPIKSSDKPS